MRLPLALAAGLAFLCAACNSTKGPSTVKVRGKVVDAKKSLAFDKQTGRLSVTFYKMTDDAAAVVDPKEARVDADGSFEIDVEPGKYRIGVVHQARIDFAPDAAAKGETYKGKYTGAKSPIVREIAGATDDLVIDMANPNP